MQQRRARPDGPANDAPSDAYPSLDLPSWMTPASVAGVLLALAGGVLASETQNAALLAAADWVSPLGRLWTNALVMLVIPLVMATLFAALADQGEARGAGRRTALTFGVFVAMLAVAGVLGVMVGLPLARALTVEPETVEALRASVAGATQGLQATQSLQFGDWLASLIPRNPIGAVASGEMMSIVVAVMLFALAAARLGPGQRAPLVRLARSVAGASFVLMRWVLLPMPVAAFCVVYPMAASAGMPLAGALGYYFVVLLGILAASIVLLYPVAMAAGVSLRRFAHGVAPAQAVAIATRSSLASLPALLDGARSRLGLRQDVADLVLPLSTATFKLNGMISAPFELFFLAQLFGVPLTPQFIVLFMGAKLLISFGTPGVPGEASTVTIPLFLAAGIPIEGAVLTNAIDAVPDILKTMLNVTADMTAAVTVERLDRVPAPVAAGPLDDVPIPVAAGGDGGTAM